MKVEITKCDQCKKTLGGAPVSVFDRFDVDGHDFCDEQCAGSYFSEAIRRRAEIRRDVRAGPSLPAKLLADGWTKVAD